MGKPNEFDALVGHNVRIYRTARQLRQKDLAQLMALSHPTWSDRQTVSLVELGKRGILVGELRDLANILGTDMATLLSEDVLKRGDPP